MRILKGLLLSMVLGCLIACGVGTHLLQKEVPTLEKPAAALYPNHSSIPSEQVQWGAYLAGMMARENHDYDKAIRYFERVAAVDSENNMLKTDMYLMKALKGDMTDMVPLAEVMARMERPELLSEYVLVALYVQDGAYEKALAVLEGKEEYGLDVVMRPLVEAWLYAGLNQPKKALAALKPLSKSKDLRDFYQMHLGLLSAYLKDNDTADKAFRSFDERQPPLVLLEFMRQFYIPRGEWTPDFPPAVQYQTAQQKPLSAELLRLFVGATIRTPKEGLSEAFQSVSSALGNEKRVLEQGLILNGLARYLNDQNVMAYIWGAELFEEVEAYDKANMLYAHIDISSDTLLFKKALNDIQMEAYDKAIPLLEALARRNPKELLLQRTLGAAYQQKGAYQKAVQAYTQAIRLVPIRHIDDFAACYMARGLAYEALGNEDKAEADFVSALTLKPDDAILLNEVGYRWLVAGKKTDKAFEYVKKAHELSPEDAHIMDSLALGYLLKKEYQKALELAEQALEKLPYSALLYERTGDIYRAMGRLREADYQYQKALDLDSDLTPEMRLNLQKKRDEIN